MSSYHLCIISINFTKIKKSKDNLFKFLNKKRIYPQYHYIPIPKFSIYKKNTKIFKNSEKYYNNSISIPIYFNLNKNKQIYIVKNLLQFLKK
jgi:dTDP-4-amino-4,6-dideoxygalactose transaminase